MGARWHRYSLMNTNNNTIDANATGLALLIIMFWGDGGCGVKESTENQCETEGCKRPKRPMREHCARHWQKADVLDRWDGWIKFAADSLIKCRLTKHDELLVHPDDWFIAGCPFEHDGFKIRILGRGR